MTSLMRHHVKHRMTFGEDRYATYTVKNKRDDKGLIIFFNVIGKKNNQSSVSDAFREI